MLHSQLLNATATPTHLQLQLPLSLQPRTPRRALQFVRGVGASDV